ncbi:potassium channel family protein [Bacillus sp. 31A1R]|uniref:Potassium channel family protein n=2 Tax=Robertmurraya mangrovi TaxID=3098077 RepID=A0ABU5J542_9BACI|nr:potassium channel family protein [Bacillus sp. 31A1R]
MSIKALFKSNKIKGKKVSFENFLILAFIYITVMVGFGMIYVLLELQGFEVLNPGNLGSNNGYIEKLNTGMYFSAITLFSVGYGDLSPIGIGRMIAVVEALIGYTIPAAFVARVVFDMDRKSIKE